MRAETFRLEVLERLRAALARMPGTNLHLLYSTEKSDPLRLLEDGRRERALVFTSHPDLPAACRPCLVTLDCRRTAPYLLQTDPGIDDPLLETSILQAHAEAFGEHASQRGLSNDERREWSVCGWLVSRQDAATIAQRLSAAAWLVAPRPVLVPPRWHDPRVLAHLWPSLTHLQQHALLGAGVIWIAPDAIGNLHRFECGTPRPEHEISPDQAKLDHAQHTTLANTGLVNVLLRAWRAMLVSIGQTPPPHACQTLHRHVAAARELGMDEDDLALYVLTAIQLRDGFARDEAFQTVLRRMRQDAISLRDVLETLPDGFWKRHALSA